MTDNSIGGPGPSGSAAQTPTPGVPNTTNQTPVGANTGHESHAGLGPSNFTSGGSGPGNFTSGGSGPNSNSGGPGRRNQNNRDQGHDNQNSGRTHQQRPADIDHIEEEESYKRRSMNLGYEPLSVNRMLGQRFQKEIIFELRDQKGDVLLHRNHQDTVNWYVPSLENPSGGEFLGLGEVKAYQGLIGCDQESLHAFLRTVDSMVRVAKERGSVIMKFDIEFETTAEHEDKKRHLAGRDVRLRLRQPATPAGTGATPPTRTQ
ncbi:hypothetical protein V8F06_013020 [Rhypophila decipiens]